MAKNLTLLNMRDMLALITDAGLQRKFIKLYAPTADDDIDWNGLESNKYITVNGQKYKESEYKKYKKNKKDGESFEDYKERMKKMAGMYHSNAAV